MRPIQFSFFSIILVLVLMSCDPATSSTTDNDQNGHSSGNKNIVLNNTPPKKSKDGFPYDLKHPGRKFMLPGSLEEISGLGWHQENELVCVNDEQGYLFFYSLTKGKMDRKVKYGHSGDYEGVEVVDGVIWTIQSNGVLSKIPMSKGHEVESEQFETMLSESDDIEALGYDPVDKVLLIGCKENSGTFSYGADHMRFVFPADPETGTWETVSPYLTIDPVELAEFKGEEKPMKFRTSGIAVHPTRSEIYLISAVDNRLLVLDRETKEILFFKKLKSKSFKQAEGICFTPEGTMYISNEGAGGDANILEFEMLQ